MAIDAVVLLCFHCNRHSFRFHFILNFDEEKVYCVTRLIASYWNGTICGISSIINIKDLLALGRLNFKYENKSHQLSLENTSLFIQNMKQNTSSSISRGRPRPFFKFFLQPKMFIRQRFLSGNLNWRRGAPAVAISAAQGD